jgi:cobalt-precorrin 5A hydrolase
MIKDIICFNENGKKIVRKLNSAAKEAGIDCANAYICNDGNSSQEFERTGLDGFSKRGFLENHALIFVGAAGIAVRAIAPYVKDKLTDSPVIVIDDAGTFVIPLLSGHAGSANKLAVTISGLIGAIPVLTTSTDVNGAFSADVFATEEGLTIHNRDGIRRVSAKALEGKPITISVKNYPPLEPVDIIVANETDREYSLLLKPKEYVVGIGMKKNKDAKAVEDFVLSVLFDNGIKTEDVYAFATIDIKEKEPALQAFSSKYRIPVIAFDAEILNKAVGDFSSSEFVKETVGVDNVCERAASLVAGHTGEVICKKTGRDGVTAAIARRSL